MTTFTVWKFETLEGAHDAAQLLRNAESDGLVKVDDVAVASWPEGEDEPKIEHHGSPGKRGAAWGGAGGIVLGAAFTVPLVGLVAGAAAGAMAGKYTKAGISDEQLGKIQGQLKPGESALFAVTDEGKLDRLGERFRGMGWQLMETNLTEAERESLYETFGGT